MTGNAAGARDRNLSGIVVDRVSGWLTARIIARSKRNTPFACPILVAPDDLIGRSLIATGAFERIQFEAMDAIFDGAKRLIDTRAPSRDVFLDVGANIGLYSLRFADRFEKTVAIEANPATFHALMANVLMSRKSRIEALCLGASDMAGRSTINVAVSGEIGWSRMGHHNWFPTYPVEIETDTVDNIMARSCPGRTVSVMKIDVEGFEVPVLEGARETLRRHQPMVFFEVLDSGQGAKAKALLMACGYDSFFTFGRKPVLSRSGLSFPVEARRLDGPDLAHSALICAFAAS